MGKYDRIEEIKISVLISMHFLVMAVLSYSVTILKEQGIPMGQIGVLTAIPSLASIMIQMVSGIVLDKRNIKSLIRTIRLFLWLGIAGLALFILKGACYGWLIAAFIFFGFGMYSTSPLYSTLVIRYGENGVPVRYSVARGMGSLIYGIGCVILGYVIQAGRYRMVLCLGVLTLVLMLFDSHCLRYKDLLTVNHRNDQEHYKFPFHYYLYLIGSLGLFIGHFMLNTYMIHVVEYLGGNNRHVGYTQLILSISEVPMAFFFPWLLKKQGIKKLVIISACFMALKIFGNAIAPNLYILMIVQAIQFAGNGLFWATSVCYVNDMVSKEDQVKGQSLLFIACSGISGFIANYTGGKILEYTSLAALKNTACICGFVGMVCMILSVINRKNRGDSKCRIFNSI